MRDSPMFADDLDGLSGVPVVSPQLDRAAIKWISSVAQILCLATLLRSLMVVSPRLEDSRLTSPRSGADGAVLPRGRRNSESNDVIARFERLTGV